MKKCKVLALAAAAALVVSAVSGCGGNTKSESETGAKKENKTIVVGASPSPHAEILEKAAKIMEKDGYKLEIKEFTDYVIPNTSVEDGSLDANYFQHITYLNDFNEKNGTHLVSVGEIHYEPFGVYPGKSKSLSEIPEGAKIAVPNDTTNEARALLLLEAQGIIKLKEGAGLTATKNDIAENPKNVDIQELVAAQIPRSIQDVDFAVINGNYAIEAGFDVEKDSLAIEDASSDAVKAYVNVIAVKEGNENNSAVKELIKVLKSDEIKTYINDTFNGAVVAVE